MRTSLCSVVLLAACSAPSIDTSQSPVEQAAPPAWMQLNAAAMIPGQDTTVSAAYVPPGSDVSFFIGGGITASLCPNQLGGACLDIQGPSFVSNTVTAGPDGRASWTFTVPNSAPIGLGVQVQAAVDFADQLWLSNSIDATVLDAGQDNDGDGLTNAQENTLGTDADAADTDADGLDDLDELLAGTNPLLTDTDNDMLDDGAEVLLGTDPLVRDTDDDGVLDGWEVLLLSDPLVVDTDGDGLDDGTEVFDTRTSPAHPDSDFDGCDDASDSEPMRSGPDVDGDGVVDGCDPCPLDAMDDSDGDGVCDSDDICDGDDTLDGDGDGVPDACDPCPIHNPDDPDGDGVCGDGLLTFVTAGTLSGGSIGGLNGGDAICQAEADAAGVGGRFVAMLSDSQQNIFGRDRVALPNESAAWYRADGGAVFSSTFEVLNSGTPLTPLNQTATGLTVFHNAWTGTLPDGRPSFRDCNGWTTDSSQGTVGRPADPFTWLNLQAQNCGANNVGLYCFEIPDQDGDGCRDGEDAAPGVVSADTDGDGVGDDCDLCPADNPDDSDGDGSCDSDDPCPFDPDDDIDGDGVCGDVDPCPDDNPDDPDGDGTCGSGSAMFVTNDIYDADLGGVAGADAICVSEASSAGLGTDWIAWISSDNQNIFQRLQALGADGPFFDLIDRPIATDLVDLTDGGLINGISVTPSGSIGSARAWTGTSAGGFRTGANCDNWTGSLFGQGTIGEVGIANAGWTNNFATSCLASYHLYCVEVP